MKNGFVYLVGAGPGDPELITVKAVNVLAEADCIIYDFLANSSLISEFDCEKIYVGKKGSDHTLTQNEINSLITKKAKEGKVVVRLKGGDPFIFGRGGEEAEDLVEADIPFCIVPGISSFYSAPAYAGIPLTHRDYASALEVITGHRRDDAGTGDDVNFPDYDPDRTYTFLMGMKNLPDIINALIDKKKFPADTQVAIISWGTRPQQQVITGTLQNIVENAGKSGISPPAIIVVGGVVNLRNKLRWYDNLPLFGKKIVVTRTRKQASKISKKLGSLGAEVIEFPTIKIHQSDDMTSLQNAIRNIYQFQWILFTSQNGVQVFFDELFKMGRDTRALGYCKIAVIGPATGDELLRYGIKPDVIPEKYIAESLVQAMKGYNINGKKVLIPCAEEARYVLSVGLENQGAHVERVHTYSIRIPDEPSEVDINEIADADIITFASSSTVENFFSIVESVNGDIASIGPITSKAVLGNGHEVKIEAGEYTIDGIVDAIVDHYREQEK